MAWAQKRVMKWSPVILLIIEMLTKSTAVTGRNTTRAYTITLAEAKNAGGSFVHGTLNQKKDMPQMRVDFLNNRAPTFQTTIGRVSVIASLPNLRKGDMAWYSTGANINIHQARAGSSDRSDDASQKKIGSGGRDQKDRPIKLVKPTEAATKHVLPNDSNPKGLSD